jgi:hypothetical protein
MNKLMIIFGASALLAAVVVACAPGEGEDAGPSCTYDEAGECDGDTLNYCDENGEDASIDCSGYSVTATCGEVDADWGNDCVVATDGECEADAGNDEVIGLPCEGTQPGCLDNLANAGTWKCTDNAGTCTGDEDNECVGNTYVYACVGGSQPWGIDCASYSGTCGTGGCQMPSGEICDDISLFCSDGTACPTDTYLCP